MNNVTTWQTWWRKRNRLDPEAYCGPFAYSVTVSTRQGTRVFADAAVVSSCREALEATAQTHGFQVLAYCFMPDHLHLLVEGSDTSHLSRFMKAYKQVTSFHYKQRTGQLLWQRSYYDHVIRDEQDAERALTYILENPVLAGLAENVAEYPYVGGELIRQTLVAT